MDFSKKQSEIIQQAIKTNFSQAVKIGNGVYTEKINYNDFFCKVAEKLDKSDLKEIFSHKTSKEMKETMEGIVDNMMCTYEGEHYHNTIFETVHYDLELYLGRKLTDEEEDNYRLEVREAFEMQWDYDQYINQKITFSMTVGDILELVEHINTDNVNLLNKPIIKSLGVK